MWVSARNNQLKKRYRGKACDSKMWDSQKWAWIIPNQFRNRPMPLITTAWTEENLTSALHICHATLWLIRIYMRIFRWNVLWSPPRTGSDIYILRPIFFKLFTNVKDHAILAQIYYEWNHLCYSGVMALYLQKLLSKLLVRCTSFIPLTNFFQTFNKCWVL